jgi:hypothetical protein
MPEKRHGRSPCGTGGAAGFFVGELLLANPPIVGPHASVPFVVNGKKSAFRTAAFCCDFNRLLRRESRPAQDKGRRYPL